MLHIIGDIHGQYQKLQTLLVEKGLVSENGDWLGDREDQLLFIGDFFDRGEGAIEALNLAMKLQRENHAYILLGNHECFILAAKFFSDFFIQDLNITMNEHWLDIGGHEPDLDRLTEEHISFLMACPFMIKIKDTLFTHADSTLYLEYGKTIDKVNQTLQDILHAKKPEAYAMLVQKFADRMSFFQHPQTLQAFLQTYGASTLVHGHTPIPYMAETEVNRPYCYGKAVNVDGGMYLGGDGFIYSTPLAMH